MSGRFEDAARALYYANALEERPDWDRQPASARDRYGRSVIAVLEAVREPDEGMLTESIWKHGEGSGHEEIWQAMLDALLAQGRGK